MCNGLSAIKGITVAEIRSDIKKPTPRHWLYGNKRTYSVMVKKEIYGAIAFFIAVVCFGLIAYTFDKKGAQRTYDLQFEGSITQFKRLKAEKGFYMNIDSVWYGVLFCSSIYDSLQPGVYVKKDKGDCIIFYIDEKIIKECQIRVSEEKKAMMLQRLNSDESFIRSPPLFR